MQARRWHASYPPGMKPALDLAADETLLGMFERSFAAYPQRTVATVGAESLSFAQLDRHAAALSAHFAALGLGAGERVALMMPNHLAFPVALVAILRSGMVAVPVNPLYTARELSHQLADAGVRCIVLTEPLHEQHRSVIAEAGVQHVLTLPGAALTPAIELAAREPDAADQPTSLAAAIARHLDARPATPKVQPTDPAILQYTGGTTGLSKGAILTHRAMSAAGLQTLSWIAPALQDQLFSVVAPLPLYHIYPLQMLLLAIRQGGVMRLIANPRDGAELLGEMKRAPFSIFIGVNTLFNALVQTPALQGIDFSGTRMVIGAGASVQDAVSKRWRAAGAPPITEAYGLTETGPAATFNPAGHSGHIGIPLASTDVRIVDADEQDVPDGTPGELLIKGPQLFAGYWQREEETRAAFTQDGFFRTGDIVEADAGGRMRIVDRKKDMILVSGFNVYPNEIEAVVAEHAGVLECACIGEPDERSGEIPHLFVVARDGALTTQDVEAHCRANLTAYKVPRRITLLEALPKSTVGKILRRELRGR